jgi:hypothetical protein
LDPNFKLEYMKESWDKKYFDEGKAALEREVSYLSQELLIPLFTSVSLIAMLLNLLLKLLLLRPVLLNLVSMEHLSNICLFHITYYSWPGTRWRLWGFHDVQEGQKSSGKGKECKRTMPGAGQVS